MQGSDTTHFYFGSFSRDEDCNLFTCELLHQGQSRWALSIVVSHNRITFPLPEFSLLRYNIGTSFHTFPIVFHSGFSFLFLTLISVPLAAQWELNPMFHSIQHDRGFLYWSSLSEGRDHGSWRIQHKHPMTKAFLGS